MAKVRMADIAQKLGISTVSVSKGLSGKDGVSEEVRKKILQTAKEMGYQVRIPEKPIEEAHTIGIIVADRFFNEEAFYYRLYTELLKGCQKLGFTLLMEIITPEEEDACALPRLLQNRKTEGLILMGEFHDAYFHMLQKQDIPQILLDFYKDNTDTDCVLSDNQQGSMLLTEKLLSSGCHRIAFVGSIQATSSIMDRYLGYCKALLKAGIFPDKELLLDDRDEKGAFISLNFPKEMPDAFVCNCDAIAIQLTRRLTEAGYRIPQDIAITGYDDFRYAEACNPPLTSYRINVQGMAEAALEMMQDKIRREKDRIPSKLIGGQIILRLSTPNS